MSSEYDRYIQSQQHQEKKSNTGATLLAGAAVIGAGAGIVSSARARGYVKEAFSGVMDVQNSAVSALRRSGFSDKLQETGAVLKAVHHGLDNKSPLFHAKNGNRFSQRFEESLTRSIEGRRRALQTPLGGKSTAMEEALHGLPYQLRMLRNQVKDDFRYKSITEELTKKMPKQMKNGLHSVLNQQDKGFFARAGLNDITELIDSARGAKGRENNWAQPLNIKDSEKEAFVHQVFASVKKFQDDGNLDQRKIKDVMKLHQTNLLEGIKDQLKPKEDFVSKMIGNAVEMQGLRPLTLKDASQQNLWDPDSMVRSVKGKEHRNAFMGKKLENLAKHVDKEFENLPLDPYLFIDKKGGIHDYRGFEKGVYNTMTAIQDNVQIPFLRFNPMDLMHFTTYQSVREAPKTYLFQRGNIDVILNGAAKTLEKHPMAHMQDAAATPLDRSYMYTNGSVFDVLTGEKVKSDVYLGSARFGMLPRMMSGVGNLHRYDYRESGSLRKLFDIGQQEHQSGFGRASSMVTKFWDENWTPNAVAKLYSGKGAETKVQVEAFKQIHNDLDTGTKELSYDLVNFLNRHAKEAYGDLGIDLKKLHSPKEVLEAVSKITHGMETGQAVGANEEVLRSGIASALRGVHSKSSKSSIEEFSRNKRVLSGSSVYTPTVAAEMSMFMPGMMEETKLITKVDDARRLVHQHALEQIESKGITVSDLVREAVVSGDLPKSSLDEIRDLKALTTVRGYWTDIYLGGDNAVEAAAREFREMMLSGGNKAQVILQSVEKQNPVLAMGPGDAPPQYFGRVGYTLMNKAKGHRHALEEWNTAVSNGQGNLKSAGKAAWSVLGQPFAGRNNIDGVTTATLPFYYFAERLDNAMSQAGLGLSQKNRGSMQSILANQLGRRVALPYMAIQQAMYFDGLTGDTVSDQLADTYVNMHKDVSWFKEITGINAIGKHIGGLTPGSDLFWGTPIGGLMKYGSFGFFGDTRDSQQVEQYYESGEDPIRKGRWWGIGSNTPWQGGKIDHYAPNWYRRMKSDWEFTDTKYGSESEYWANHWMPTLTNPLAPIRHFITDPDHYTKKHAESRPYPVSGGINEFDMIPVVGPALNGTLGQVLNPTRVDHRLERSHREYIEKMNTHIAGQYSAATQGGYLQTMPGGGYAILSGGGGISTPVTMGDGIAGGSGGGMGGSAAMGQLTAINQGIVGAASGMAPSLSSLDSLRDPNFMADLASIASPNSMGNMINNTWYKNTEMAGIYGFSVNTLLGYDESAARMTLESSSRMMSYSKAWWDMELGGADMMGGNLSEIFRRYVPRDKGNYYNPIRNTMPDWLPGPEYFTDFLHGDPYGKLKKGEMRLPGSAYESLNQLHPDAFGEYGAFDRFKILADVAPYSDQYRHYRKIVSQMNQGGMLTPQMQDQYATIRDQVTERKKKYNLYPRKFGNAQINEEHVTITKVLDANTFLTEEYGSNPIKLAGVEVKESAENTRQWLSQFIREGARIKVGLDADPLFRVRDDTMQTMRAVVYANQNEEGRTFYESIRGQSLNAILARRNFGDENGVNVRDDGSATSTAALHDQFDRGIGKTWEFVTHDVIPAIPIVNVIADKFMQIKSPLEMYRERRVYGKEWKPWYDPWGGWIEPMLDKAASQNPLVAATGGYGVGWLFGRGHTGKFYGKWAGALTFGVLAAKRALDETAGNLLPKGSHGDYAWIPERRQKEREIEEYFDVLKYMKYRGLYEKARKLALEQEGIDLDEILDDSMARGKRNKGERRYLETTKKWLAIEEKSGYADKEFIQERREQIRNRLNAADENRGMHELGPYAMQAMQYRNEYESTLYGADPHGDMTKIFKALPDNDREFFNHFMTASPKERQEILKLVPHNQRRFYQAKWGMKMDDTPSLRGYFSGKQLPGADWEGWRPDVSLEEIKVKVVKNEGLELTEFGLWGDDELRAEQNNAPTIQPFAPSNYLDVTRIERVLRGAGLSDVDVTMTVGKGMERHSIRTALDIMRDRKEDIVRELNSNLGALL